jgi:hypothetical protein
MSVRIVVQVQSFNEGSVDIKCEKNHKTNCLCFPLSVYLFVICANVANRMPAHFILKVCALSIVLFGRS